MKYITAFLIIFLIFPIYGSGQQIHAGKYRSTIGGELIINSNSTFYYIWNFDLASSWSFGKISKNGGFIFLETIPICDTVSVPLFQGSSNTKDTLVLSSDTIPGRIANIDFASIILSGGGQNRKAPPIKLLYKNGLLYELNFKNKIKKAVIGINTKKTIDVYFYLVD